MKIINQIKKNKKIKSRLKKLFRNFFIFISVSLLFIFPLKYLCKLSGAPYIVLLVLSGILAYVNTILYLILNDKNINISLIQFFRIFFKSICLTFLIAAICYLLGGIAIDITNIFS